MCKSSAQHGRVSITIELFGAARMACGRKRIAVQAPPLVSAAELAAALADACPALVGVALRDDLSGLLQSYTANLNGTEFVDCARLDGGSFPVRDGDTLLIFSSQAGG